MKGSKFRKPTKEANYIYLPKFHKFWFFPHIATIILSPNPLSKLHLVEKGRDNCHRFALVGTQRLHHLACYKDLQVSLSFTPSLCLSVSLCVALSLTKSFHPWLPYPFIFQSFLPFIFFSLVEISLVEWKSLVMYAHIYLSWMPQRNFQFLEVLLVSYNHFALQVLQRRNWERSVCVCVCVCVCLSLWSSGIRDS